MPFPADHDGVLRSLLRYPMTRMLLMTAVVVMLAIIVMTIVAQPGADTPFLN